MAIALTFNSFPDMSGTWGHVPGTSNQAAAENAFASSANSGTPKSTRPPRVGYKKSRKGCAQCKRRHVKCNEESPCSNCLRHGVACSLAGGPNVPRDDAGPRTRSVASSSNASVPRTSPPNVIAAERSPVAASLRDSSPAQACNHFAILTSSIDRPPGGTAECWQLDLQLMHHYMAHTAEVITEHSDLEFILQIWRNELPRVAFAHDSLMHALLGLSALHRASQEPGQSAYLRASAVDRLDKAVASHGQEINNITGSTAEAKYLLMWIVTLAAYAIQPTEVSALDSISEIMLLVKENDIVLAETWYTIAQGVFAPILTRSFTEIVPLNLHNSSSTYTLPEGIDFSLAHLDFMLGIESMLPEDRRACISVLTELKAIYQLLINPTETCSVSSIIRFPKQDPVAFGNLIKGRIPQGVIILAYYCVLLNVLDARWWIRGWAERILAEIVVCLDESWKHWVEWPVGAVIYGDEAPGSDNPVAGNVPEASSGRGGRW